MSPENKGEKHQAIKAELVESRGKTRKVKLTYPDGSIGVISAIVPQTHKRISDQELMALSVMRLVVTEVAFDETTGVDQAGLGLKEKLILKDYRTIEKIIITMRLIGRERFYNQTAGQEIKLPR